MGIEYGGGGLPNISRWVGSAIAIRVGSADGVDATSATLLSEIVLYQYGSFMLAIKHK